MWSGKASEQETEKCDQERVVNIHWKPFPSTEDNNSKSLEVGRIVMCPSHIKKPSFWSRLNEVQVKERRLIVPLAKYKAP